MYLEITTPDKELYSGNIKLIQLPGIDGLFEILNMHAPLISILAKGKIKIQTEDDQVVYCDIKGGVVEVLKNKILVLAE